MARHRYLDQHIVREENIMNMVERYLGSVAWQLPQANREDIVSELRDDILSRIEAAEAASGTPPGETEIAGILRATGHPATVAARYTGQGGLLPAEAVPWWWAHVRALAALIVVLYAAHALLALFSGQPPTRALIQAAVQGFGSFAKWLGVLTLVYLAFVRYLYPKLLNNWDPMQLSTPPPAAHQPSLVSHAIGLAFGIAFLLWWTGAVNMPEPASGLRPGPVWEQLYWPVLVVMLLGIARGLAGLLESFLPPRRQLMALLGLAIAVISIAIAGYVLRNGPLVLAAGEVPSRAVVGAVAGINAVGPIVLVIIVIANLFEGWRSARQLLQALR
jgi:prepilin signal peptidase PulO-like enzyme (type II secretory pathway)